MHWLRKITPYLLLVLLLSIFFSFTYRAYQYDYTKYPLVYSHDGIESLKLIRHIVEYNNHWVVNNELGYPFGSNLYVDFPTADQFSIQLIKVLSIFTKNHFLIYSLFIFSSYLLCSLSSFWVLRKLKIKTHWAILASLTFSFLPYHQIRTTVGHIFLTQYFTIPLVVYLCFQLLQNKLNLSSRKSLVQTIIFLVLIGSSGTAYYAFFAIILFLLSGLVKFLFDKNTKALGQAVILSLTAAVIVFINLLPSFQYQLQEGKNFALIRDPQRVEEFSLRINRMLVPLPNGKAKFFQNILEPYYNNVQHEQYQWIGLVSALGLMLLFIEVIRRKRRDLVYKVATVNLLTIIFASVGGIAFPFSFFVSPVIRSYGRVSIFMSFMSLWAFFFVLQKFIMKIEKSQRRHLTLALAILIIFVGLFEQISSFDPHTHFWKIKSAFDTDQEFIQRIENTLPANSKVLELPIIEYPEAKGQCELDSYDLLMPYLHSDKLSWSFGQVRGRGGEYWFSWLNQLSARQISQAAALAGFDAIYLDGRACIDLWHWQGNIALETNGKLIENEDKKILLVDMREYASNFENNDDVFQPITWSFDDNFFERKQTALGTKGRINKQTTIEFYNPSNIEKEMKLIFKIALIEEPSLKITIQSNSTNEQFLLTNKNRVLESVFLIPRGQSVIQIESLPGQEFGVEELEIWDMGLFKQESTQ